VPDDDPTAGTPVDADPDAVPGGRHSQAPATAGKGSWLRQLGMTPADLAGTIIAVAAYKGGVGKTFLGYELSYLFGAILVDLDWDRGNASRAWGYREETRVSSPLLDALDRGRAPRPLAGGPWRPDLVPCTADFGPNQPGDRTLTDALEAWAKHWAEEYRCPVVVDTHPGAQSSTFAAVAAAHAVVVPTVLGEREMEATEGLVAELKSYRLILIPNKVGISPPERYITWLQRIAANSFVPVGPPISNYPKLMTRQRRMAVCASDPVPVWARPLVSEMHSVGEKVLQHVAT
jgi:chromosome partitioning protein